MMHDQEQAARMTRAKFFAKLTETVTYMDFAGRSWTQPPGTQVSVTCRDYEDSESLDEGGLLDLRPVIRFVATLGEDHFVIHPYQFQAAD